MAVRKSVKYLAFGAILAGWLCFCYWWFSTRIYPRLQAEEPIEAPEFLAGFPGPLAFTWGETSPMAGESWERLKNQLDSLEARDQIVILHGYYFLDEAPTPTARIGLATQRIQQSLAYLDIPADRLMTAIQQQEVVADVRSIPFEAVEIELITASDMWRERGDTLEICFPLKDTLALPGLISARLEEWGQRQKKVVSTFLFAIGTADGTGIAESSDRGLDRAELIKQLLIEAGWTDLLIETRTGQRNHPKALRNRCVVLFPGN